MQSVNGRLEIMKLRSAKYGLEVCVNRSVLKIFCLDEIGKIGVVTVI